MTDSTSTTTDFAAESASNRSIKRFRRKAGERREEMASFYGLGGELN